MADIRVIGADTGPIPGLVLLDVVLPADPGAAAPWLDRVEVVQCSAGLAVELVDGVLAQGHHDRVLIQVERFVTGRRSSRSRTAGAGQVTRDMVGALQGWAEHFDRNSSGKTTGFVQRSAGQVKPWATDERLERAGLLELCKGMRHARDAARHALFCAVHDAGVPDPLSKAWKR